MLDVQKINVEDLSVGFSYETSGTDKRLEQICKAIDSLDLSKQRELAKRIERNVSSKAGLYRIRLPFLFHKLFGVTFYLRDDNDDGEQVQIIDETLSTLTPREEKLIKMRFGIDGFGVCHSLERIGQHFGVTRERIRQLETKAKKKLRHPSRSRRLKTLLEEKLS